VEGGSMITAAIANTYNRDVFAVPGKSRDEKSAGCNFLIKKNKAALIENFSDVLYNMNWEKKEIKVRKEQFSLPLNLNSEEEAIVTALKKNEKIHINELVSICNMPVGKLSAVLLQMELNNYVVCHPGKFFSLP
jgi:DNA processing protein